MTKTAAYLRISTDEQNIDTQRDVIASYCKANGIAKPVLYEDIGFSGDTVDRPAFKKLRADIKAGLFDCVLVFRLDRVSRKTSAGISILHGWIDRGVTVCSVMEGLKIDSSSPVTVDVILPLLIGLASIEQKVRRERQRAGIDRAKREGRYTGRKPGSTVTPPSTARLLRDAGHSIASICEQLGQSRSTVQRHLRVT